MKHQRHFESVDASRKAAQARAFIADLNRIVEILDVDIATEEEKSWIRDRSRPEYPVLARALTARRDNLRQTIAALERVSVAGPHAPLPEQSGQWQ